LIWDVQSAKPLASLHESGVHAFVFRPDGLRVLTLTDGTAQVWHVFTSTQELIDHAKASVPRCLTPNQREKFFLHPHPPQWCDAMKKWPYHDPAKTPSLWYERFLIEARNLLKWMM
jgi:WD40 repeat protein